jgi:hypothetical protein
LSQNYHESYKNFSPEGLFVELRLSKSAAEEKFVAKQLQRVERRNAQDLQDKANP